MAKPKKEIPRFKLDTCLTCGRKQVPTVAQRCIQSPYCYERHRKDIRDARNIERGVEPLNKLNKPINKISDKQAKLKAAYKILRDQFMKGKQCQANWDGCTITATECHHAGGRLGGNMLDSTTYRALCHNCHTQVELQPERAKKENLSIDRL